MKAINTYWTPLACKLSAKSGSTPPHPATTVSHQNYCKSFLTAFPVSIPALHTTARDTDEPYINTPHSPVQCPTQNTAITLRIKSTVLTLTYSTLGDLSPSLLPLTSCPTTPPFPHSTQHTPSTFLPQGFASAVLSARNTLPDHHMAAFPISFSLCSYVTMAEKPPTENSTCAHSPPFTLSPFILPCFSSCLMYHNLIF